MVSANEGYVPCAISKDTAGKLKYTCTSRRNSSLVYTLPIGISLRHMTQPLTPTKAYPNGVGRESKVAGKPPGKRPAPEDAPPCTDKGASSLGLCLLSRHRLGRAPRNIIANCTLVVDDSIYSARHVDLPRTCRSQVPLSAGKETQQTPSQKGPGHANP